MGAARPLLYLVGALLVIGGLVMMFFESGLAGWMPAGIALAGLLILVGLLVVGLSHRFRTDRTVHVDEEPHGRHEARPYTAPPEHVMEEREVERDQQGRAVHTRSRTSTTRPVRDPNPERRERPGH